MKEDEDGETKAKPKARGKNAAEKRKSTTKKPVATTPKAVKKETGWVLRQKAVREHQATSKTLISYDTLRPHWNVDASSISLSERRTLEKKVIARLGENNRWLYKRRGLGGCRIEKPR